MWLKKQREEAPPARDRRRLSTPDPAVMEDFEILTDASQERRSARAR
jgi:hypothetical protein